MLRTAAIMVAAAAALGISARPAVAQTQTFHCESYGGRQQVCRADTRGGVRLVRQLSGSRCVEGRTWGLVRGGVWVSDGCRAQFQTGYTTYGNRSYSRRRGDVYNNGYNNGRWNQAPGTGNTVQNGARLCQEAASQQFGIRRGDVQSWLENDGSAYARYAWSGGGRSGACYFDANGNVAVRMIR